MKPTALGYAVILAAALVLAALVLRADRPALVVICESGTFEPVAGDGYERQRADCHLGDAAGELVHVLVID